GGPRRRRPHRPRPPPERGRAGRALPRPPRGVQGAPLGRVRPRAAPHRAAQGPPRGTPTRDEGGPMSAPPRTARGTRTRERILAGATQVFAEHGYHDASIVKVTEAAEVAQGTFYLYFYSKQEVFEEVVRELN